MFYPLAILAAPPLESAVILDSATCHRCGSIVSPAEITGADDERGRMGRLPVCWRCEHEAAIRELDQANEYFIL